MTISFDTTGHILQRQTRLAAAWSKSTAAKTTAARQVWAKQAAQLAALQRNYFTGYVAAQSKMNQRAVAQARASAALTRDIFKAGSAKANVRPEKRLPTGQVRWRSTGRVAPLSGCFEFDFNLKWWSRRRGGCHVSVRPAKPPGIQKSSMARAHLSSSSASSASTPAACATPPPRISALTVCSQSPGHADSASRLWRSMNWVHLQE